MDEFEASEDTIPITTGIAVRARPRLTPWKRAWPWPFLRPGPARIQVDDAEWTQLEWGVTQWIELQPGEHVLRIDDYRAATDEHLWLDHGQVISYEYRLPRYSRLTRPHLVTLWNHEEPRAG